MTQYSKAIQEIINRSQGTNQHSQRLNLLQRKVLEATEALENIVEKRDPALPLEAHTLKVAKASEKLKRNLEKQAQALEDFRYTAANDLNTQISQQANLIPNPHFRDAILNRFVSMKSTDQVKFLNELLAEQDGPSLAAILEAPKAATGLSKDHANRLWDSYTKAAAPEPSAAMSEYWQIESATDAAFKAAKRAANELSKPEEVQRIIRQQEQAMDAEMRLDEALE